ncbi:ECF RNA polymerase sigma factor SigE [Gemmata obscuriglobus]|uniref:RNA polymerase sigma factor 70 region 4 type 2 domain-containing protein n=1 Tax=Gemmata obscuriglobus TaxID=114 RepID=A0A2Z3GZ67_9BACT|nr:sigma-70 family RNA polymerase sigma factor [Gemmata obscuriglobus]AWM37971.1 hypothetical protein C1280_13870 [Gemmata obscuriglobus]QEG29169.1 ECF RNA polymerase sigma factor SigE [Gemmata obscuriglobus]VTS07913.1 wd-40 repeat protein : Uncultured bacterium genome assembly Metasoil_fosmids_resub OS=uncultured bacterium PE=4 SV=1: Sigma70_r2: Sigma70_r4_2: WD40: WD40 [Gemmata obscuriglobus UQM 2246]
MPAVPQGLAQRIRELALPLRCESRTDAELLSAFATSRDEDAFAALVVRYRHVVWDTCRLALGSDADAEDAFQAVFIALARDAGKVCPGTLEGWLRTVALRASANARVAARRRELAHRRLSAQAAPAVEEVAPEEDLLAIVREELAGLPAGLRVALSLYYLEGKTQAEVGRILGVTDRAIAARLRRGLEALRGRLVRRGTAVSAATLVAVLGGVATGAGEAVPAGLTATATAGALAAAGGKSLASAAAQLAVGLTGSGEAARFKLYGLLLALAGLVGLGAIGGAVVQAERPAVVSPEPAAPLAPQPAPLVDGLGDELPTGAVARIGTDRFRAGRAAGAEDVAFFPDGKTLASVHGGAEVSLWDAATGKRVLTFDGPAGARWVVADPTGRRLAVAGAAEVWVWELGAGAPRVAWTWRAKQTPPQPAVPALAFSPDGSVVAAGDWDGKCTRLFNAGTGAEVANLPGRTRAVSAAGGKYLAVICGSGRDAWADRLVFWDAPAGRAARALDAPPGEVFVDVSQSADGRAVVRAASGAVRLVDVASGKELGSWTVRDGARRGLAFLPGGKELVEVEGGRVRVRAPATGAEVRGALPIPALVLHTLNNNLDVAKQLSPDGKYLATSSLGAVTVWDLATGRPAGPRGQVQGGIRAVAFSQDGRSVLTFADRADEVCVWDAATGEPGSPLVPPAGTGFVGLGWATGSRPLTLCRPPVPPDPGSIQVLDLRTRAAESVALPSGQTWVSGTSGHLAPFAVAASGERVAVASGATVDVIDPTGKGVRRLTTRATAARLALSADGRTLAAVTHDWPPRAPGGGPLPPRVAVELWDVAAGRARPVSVSQTSWDLFQVAPALSADGRWLAAVTWEGAVSLVEVSSGRTGQQLECPERPGALAFSPDGRLLAAGGTDGAVAVWDLATGRLAKRFRGHRGAVVALAFAPDGRRLASGSVDGTALVWGVTDLRNAGGGRPVGELRDAVLGADVGAAHRAGLALSERPDDAVRLLAPKLASPPEPDAADVARWIDELGDDAFAVRERAQTALEKAGEAVGPALRKRLASDPPAEARFRLERLVARLESAANPARATAARIVATLERAGTPAARRALEDAARRGSPGLKAEIEAALARMPAPPASR